MTRAIPRPAGYNRLMDTTPQQINAAINGYPYACSCGEQHRTKAGAWGCRKCRQYLMEDDFDNRTVVDVRTGDEVSRPE